MATPSAAVPALLDTVAAGIRSGAIRSIIALTGAGVSVASGIPDFRSPGGLYATLRPDLITASASERLSMSEDPTDVVSWSLFQSNQLPYLEVRRPFILGTASRKWKPTIAHAFFALLDKKGLLRRLYTQNIDGLDRATPIHADRIVNVHGALDRVACEFCGEAADFDGFCDAVRRQVKDIYGIEGGPVESTPILCAACGKPGVKPATVLYGRNLPDAFFHAAAADFPCRGGPDLMIIAGTSLTVAPANTLPLQVPEGTPRLLFNATEVGGALGDALCGGASSTDAWVRGDCDAGFLAFATALGWVDELRALVAGGKCPCCPASRAVLGLP